MTLSISGWESCSISDISIVVRGITFPANAKIFEWKDSLVCCLRTSNIQKNVDVRDVYFVEKSYVKRDEQLVKSGDILMSMANSYELVGKVARVDLIPYPSAFGAFLAAIRPTNLVDGGYLFNYLKSSYAQNKLREGSSQTTNIANISAGTLGKLDIPLPPLAEQRRIADKLDTVLTRVDALNDRLARITPLLKRFRQSVLAAATSGRLTEDWRLKQPNVLSGLNVVVSDAEAKKIMIEKDPVLAKKKSTTHSQINKKYVFELPEGWVFTTWGALTEWITYGFTRPMPSTKEGRRLLTAKDVYPFDIRLNSSSWTSIDSFAELSEKDRPAEGDLLITKDGSIGRAALVRTSDLFCINQSVAVCWLRSTVMNKSYLEIVANSDFTQRFVADMAKGMAIQHLSIVDFACCPLPVPAVEEQAEIVRRVEILFAYADRLEARLQTARTAAERLMPALLAKAFRGELVPQDLNDEPAAELLRLLREARAADAPTKTKRGRKAAVAKDSV